MKQHLPAVVAAAAPPILTQALHFLAGLTESSCAAACAASFHRQNIRDTGQLPAHKISIHDEPPDALLRRTLQSLQCKVSAEDTKQSIKHQRAQHVTTAGYKGQSCENRYTLQQTGLHMAGAPCFVACRLWHCHC
jgi:hypothetical protein